MVSTLETPLVRLNRIVRGYGRAQERLHRARAQHEARLAIKELLEYSRQKAVLEQELGRPFPALPELVADLEGGQ